MPSSDFRNRSQVRGVRGTGVAMSSYVLRSARCSLAGGVCWCQAALRELGVTLGDYQPRCALNGLLTAVTNVTLTRC
jgi:hypothetical protein